MLSQNVPTLPIEGFADDILALIPGTHDALIKLKNILGSFSETSCLQLNTSKTEVMSVSPLDRDSSDNIIKNVGFRVVDMITHLGLCFDNKLQQLDINWTNKIEKLKKLKNFFNSLRPNYTTKISLIKTYFLSQMSYIAPVFIPSPAHINEIRTIIVKFLFPLKNLFPVQRVFLPSEQGGLGIPDPESFVKSLTHKFVFRSLTSDQPWSLCLKSFFPQQNITLCCIEDLKPVIPSSPSLIGYFIDILDSFHSSYFKNNNNFFHAPLFHSNVIMSPLNNKYNIPIPPTFTGRPIERVRLGDCIDYSNKKIFSFGQLTNKLQHQMSFNEYSLIYSIVRKNTYRLDIPINPPPPASLYHLFSKNPNSRYIRNIISNKKSLFEILPCVNFFNIYCRSQYDFSQTKNFMTSWNISFMPTEIRNFALLRTNNKLILNKQRAQFSHVSSTCSFCKFFPLTKLYAETPEHLFFCCSSTYSIIEKYFENFFDNFNFSLKELFFKGANCDDAKLRAYLNIEITLFCHYIFETKNLNKLPTYTGLLYHVSFIKKFMLSVSDTYKKLLNHVTKTMSGQHINHLKMLENIPN